MPEAGCYSLDLYCRHASAYPDQLHAYDEFPHQFTAEHGSTCRREARKRGWIFHRDGEVTCPKCARRKKDPRNA